MVFCNLRFKRSRTYFLYIYLVVVSVIFQTPSSYLWWQVLFLRQVRQDG